MKRIYSILIFLITAINLFAYEPSGRGYDFEDTFHYDTDTNGFFVIVFIIIFTIAAIIGGITVLIDNIKENKEKLNTGVTNLFKDNLEEQEFYKEKKAFKSIGIILGIVFILIFILLIVTGAMKSPSLYILFFLIPFPILIFVHDFILLCKKVKYYLTFKKVEEKYKVVIKEIPQNRNIQNDSSVREWIIIASFICGIFLLILLFTYLSISK